MEDVRENDQHLFYVGVNMVIMADTKEELDSITETLRNMANGSERGESYMAVY